MNEAIAVAGLLSIGAITPGPNNLLVLRQCVVGGWRAALPVGIGIVSGGVALLIVVVLGANSLFRLGPLWNRAVHGVACLFLIGVGAALLWGSVRSSRAKAPPGPAPPMGRFLGLFVFQFLNPKAWLLMIAVVSSLGASPALLPVVLELVGLFVLVSTLCLALWSLAGVLLMRALDRPGVRVWLDRLTGGLLIVFAFLLLFGGQHVH